MKKLFILFIVFNISVSYSQNIDDFGRIVLNSYISEKSNLKAESKKLLETKLNEISSNYGIGGENSNSRFIITANANVITKDIIAGPPQMIAQKIELTLFIGDAVENTVFSSLTMPLEGVGTNETKAYIDAFKKVKTQNDAINEFIDNGKNKILNYYESNCNLLISQARSLAEKEDFCEAIYRLMQIPNVCTDCYQRALETSDIIYKNKIDSEGKTLLTQANAIWSTSPDKEGAMKIKPILLRIDKNASCYNEVGKLTQKVESKLKADEIKRLKKEEQTEIRRHQLALQNAKNKDETERFRINAYREIAVEYLRNQPKSYIYYRNIYWY